MNVGKRIPGGKNRAQTNGEAMGRERELERAQADPGSQPENVGRQKGRLGLGPLLPDSPRFQAQHQLAAAGHCRRAFQMDPVPSDKLPPSPGRRKKHCPGPGKTSPCRDLLTEAGGANMEMSSLCRGGVARKLPPLPSPPAFPTLKSQTRIA